ncbi:sensor domain-containing diguanylate cyclase [Photobacterium aquae]|nr:diguanylate cyclase [Photobacterium aquae]
MNNWISKLSLNQRLSFPIMAFILAVFACFQFTSYRSYLNIERDNLLTRTQILATGVGANLTAAIQFNDFYAAEEILASFNADNLITMASLELPNHTVFAQYHNENNVYVAPTQKQETRIRDNGYYFSHELLYMIVPVTINSSEIGHIHLAVSLNKLHQIRVNHLQVSLFLLILISATGVYIINRLQLWVVTPITKLNDGIKRIINDKQYLPILEQKHSNDEFYELTRSFNNMVSTISQRDNELQAAMKHLSDEKSFAMNIIETVQHALLVVDQQGNITLANNTCHSVFGRPVAMMMYQPLTDILQPVDKDAFTLLFNQALKQNHQLDNLLIEGLNNKGEVRTYQIISRPLHQQYQILFAISDVTISHQAARQLQLAAKVFDNSQDSILVLDSKGVISMVNSTYLNITGFTEEQINGQHYSFLVDINEFNQVSPVLRRELSANNQWHGEINSHTANGEVLPLFVRTHRITDPYTQEVQTVVVASDQRSLHEMQRLEHMANHDPLTSLPNRVKLMQTLDSFLSHQVLTFESFAVLFIDLDGFKSVNDTYGHNIGDEVLKIIAKRLNDSVRKCDMVSRLAGDEFVILLSPTISEEGVNVTSERILSLLREPLHIPKIKNHIELGASIGCYYVNATDFQNSDDILRRADKAMYEAKMKGKGQVAHFNSLNNDLIL